MEMRALRFVAALALGLASGCAHTQTRPDGGVGLLPVGAPASDLVGKDVHGKEFRLSSLRGHPVVVYFYPKDESPGCTSEACAFRDYYLKYQAEEATIFGVSEDTEESHAEFLANHSVPFPLVADEDGSVAKAYGVPSTLGLTARVTFLIGPDGRVQRVWPNVDPGVNADEVLAAIKSTSTRPAP